MSDLPSNDPPLRARANQAGSPRILHIANWYPNPWNDIEGNFVKAQFDLFREVTAARLVHVQVRTDTGSLLAFRRVILSDCESGYYLLTRFEHIRIQALLTTILLILVLLRERAWRYDLLHFHIAWPLLSHVHVWHRLFRIPLVISEHWSAYHYKFHLPEGSAALRRMQQPFRLGFPVIAVSKALLNDIRAFAGANEFSGYVVPNVVPLLGTAHRTERTPVLFTVSRWVEIKDPVPMLEGLARAAADGAAFELVIGGFGPLLEEMNRFVEDTALAGCTRFLGKMSKDEITTQLAESDGYLFSSHYETFSVACAEALGAGVPLIGPFIPAIAEYAGPDDWQQVSTRDASGWAAALGCFLKRLGGGEFGNAAIAARAAARFAPDVICNAYRTVLSDIAPGVNVRNSEHTR